MSMSYRSDIACITYRDDKGDHVRVYYQDRYGRIWETKSHNRTWNKTSLLIGSGRLNTGIAAIALSQGKSARIYFFNENNQLVERCTSSDKPDVWVNGNLDNCKFVGGDISGVTAALIHEHPVGIEVYYQGKDGDPYVAGLDHNGGGWSSNAMEFGTVPWGSAFSALVLPGISRRIYVDGARGSIIEVASADGLTWTIDGFATQSENHNVGSGIASAYYPTGNRVYVFVVTSKDNLVYYSRNASSPQWEGPSSLTKAMHLSAVTCSVLETACYIYFQGLDGKLYELVLRPGENMAVPVTIPLPG